MKPMDPSLTERLRCAACAGNLSRGPDRLTCDACGAVFPIVRGVPVIVDERSSVFTIDECAASGAAARRGRALDLKRLLRRGLAAITPWTGSNIAARRMIPMLVERLEQASTAPRVLVIGGATIGVGMEGLVDAPGFLVVESDVVLGARTNLVCDAHRLPFADQTFDAVVVQAVFEYIADPFHAADEIHRVLRPRGWLYAESPFMQQVHGGRCDFFRFSPVGHRRLFRRFDEEESGISGGPGMALAWAYRYFLRSLARSAAGRALAEAIALWTSSWLYRVDRSLAATPAAYDAASAFYFLGRKSETTLSDRAIVASYRGTWKMHG